jgi:hypothetical protein
LLCRAQILGQGKKDGDVATWNARSWVAGLIGCDPSELLIRSTDRYGATETQTRYERGGEPVARLTVAGPVRTSFEAAGQGHWAVTAQLGAGTYKVQSLDVPESDEIVY